VVDLIAELEVLTSEPVSVGVVSPAMPLYVNGYGRRYKNISKTSNIILCHCLGKYHFMQLSAQMHGNNLPAKTAKTVAHFVPIHLSAGNQLLLLLNANLYQLARHQTLWVVKSVLKLSCKCSQLSAFDV
jgi:hypothetical protein